MEYFYTKRKILSGYVMRLWDLRVGFLVNFIPLKVRKYRLRDFIGATLRKGHLSCMLYPLGFYVEHRRYCNG